jgi:hypothetical protein
MPLAKARPFTHSPLVEADWQLRNPIAAIGSTLNQSKLNSYCESFMLFLVLLLEHELAVYISAVFTTKDTKSTKVK